MGQQSLIYAFVARDTVVLAEYTGFRGNFVTIASHFLVKLPATNIVTYNCDGNTFNYLVEDGLTYCVVAVESVGQQMPIAFLVRVKDDFSKRYGGGKATTAAASSLNREFGLKLKEHMQYCVDHTEEINKLAKVQAQVSEVKTITVENIEKVLDRGEKIELLVDKTENLRSEVFTVDKLSYPSHATDAGESSLRDIKGETVGLLAQRIRQPRKHFSVEGYETTKAGVLLTQRNLKAAKPTKETLKVEARDTSLKAIANTPTSSETSKVCIINHPDMLKHKSRTNEDEIPDRVRQIMQSLSDEGLLQRCKLLESQMADPKHLLAVHKPDYVKFVPNRPLRRSEKVTYKKYIGDVYFSNGTRNAAFLAAGSVVQGCQLVADGQYDAAFAIVRPPGHHALPSYADGFCVFNNVAVGAQYLLDKGYQKILIVDMDIHHANGTQKIFYKSKEVLVVSIHSSKVKYPFDGNETPNRGIHCIGEDAGLGYNVNLNLPAGYGDADMLFVLKKILLPLISEFKPEMILVSAGYDAAKGDRLGDAKLSAEGIAKFIHTLKQVNAGRLVLSLEGGYTIDVLAKCVVFTVRALLGDQDVLIQKLDKDPLPLTVKLVEDVLSILSSRTHWDIFKRLTSEAASDADQKSEGKVEKPAADTPEKKTSAKNVDAIPLSESEKAAGDVSENDPNKQKGEACDSMPKNLKDPNFKGLFYSAKKKLKNTNRKKEDQKSEGKPAAETPKNEASAENVDAIPAFESEKAARDVAEYDSNKKNGEECESRPKNQKDPNFKGLFYTAKKKLKKKNPKEDHQKSEGKVEEPAAEIQKKASAENVDSIPASESERSTGNVAEYDSNKQTGKECESRPKNPKDHNFKGLVYFAKKKNPKEDRQKSEGKVEEPVAETQKKEASAENVDAIPAFEPERSTGDVAKHDENPKDPNFKGLFYSSKKKLNKKNAKKEDTKDIGEDP